jgi:hypothetical protein
LTTTPIHTAQTFTGELNMSFTALTSTEITSGKPVTSTTGTKIKNNFDDHEARIQAIEGGSATTFPPIILRVNGPYGQYGAVNGIIKLTTNFPIVFTGVRILIDHAGSSGITQVDVKYKSGGGAYTSMLLTQPSVSYTAGDDSISSNAVLDPAHSSLLAGDIIRLDLTSVQTGGRSFTVRIDYNRA